MKFKQNLAAFRVAVAVFLLSGCNFASPATAVPSGQPSKTRDTRVSEAFDINPAALKSAATDAEVRRFYKVNGWHAVWSEQAGRALEEALAQRSAHGLDRIAFLDKPLDLQRPVDREIMLTRAALHYAMALASGWTDPAELHQIYTLARPKLDLRTSLSRALDRGALAQWFAGLAPQDKDYAILSKAYLAFRKEALLPSRPALGSSAIIQPGDDDIRIPAIRQQLAEGDYLPPQEGPTATANPAADRDPVSVTYEPDLVAAVKILQRDFGIAADGVIGPDTLALLNLRPGDRAQALAVALERRRWLARKPPATRIDVNIAAARLTYYRDGIVVDHRKVIVGRPGNETPQLLAPIYRLVANPTWTIPRSIQRGEMAGVSRAYLRSHNMVRRGGWIVQKSGPGNALGQVKFDMHDDQAIYLHDTSAPSLFARSERHLSHGCVRVDDALGFASLIAEDQGVTEKWTRAQNSGRQTFVALPHSIPVRLIYQNVFVDDASKVSFRTDPYAWNGPVAAALGFDNRSNAKARPEAIEVGP